MSKNKPEYDGVKLFETPMERRQFLKCSALLGGSLAASGVFAQLMNGFGDEEAWAETNAVGMATTPTFSIFRKIKSIRSARTAIPTAA